MQQIVIIFSKFSNCSNLMYYKLKLHLFELLWICCTAFRFVVCGQVESHTTQFRFVVDLL
jgi:hypothetical protein